MPFQSRKPPHGARRQTPKAVRPEYGSFNWLRERGNAFTEAVTSAFLRANPSQLHRLERLFPRVAQAHRQQSWDRAS